MDTQQEYIYLEKHGREWLWDAVNRVDMRWIGFERDVGIGPYNVEFIGLKLRMVIEVDECGPEFYRRFDSRKINSLRRAGFKVISFWSADLLNQQDHILNVIESTARKISRAGQPGRKRKLSRRRSFPLDVSR